MKYIQFVGEDMNVGTALTNAREAANTYFREFPWCEIHSENIIQDTTPGMKSIVIILLRVSV